MLTNFKDPSFIVALPFKDSSTRGGSNGPISNTTSPLVFAVIERNPLCTSHMEQRSCVCVCALGLRKRDMPAHGVPRMQERLPLRARNGVRETRPKGVWRVPDSGWMMVRKERRTRKGKDTVVLRESEKERRCFHTLVLL